MVVTWCMRRRIGPGNRNDRPGGAWWRLVSWLISTRACCKVRSNGVCPAAARRGGAAKWMPEARPPSRPSFMSENNWNSSRVSWGMPAKPS